jgi:hypothetical protein
MGTRQINPNPTTFQYPNEDRKCEIFWTLPSQVSVPGAKPSLLNESEEMSRSLCNFSNEWGRQRLAIDSEQMREVERGYGDPQTLNFNIDARQKQLDLRKVQIYRETYKDAAIALRGKLLAGSQTQNSRLAT